MSTDKQIAANRANAQKSTGPRSIEGKAASRLNALKHGMYAADKTMFREVAADLEALAAELHREHRPRNSGERFLVDILIHNEWRLRRVRRADAGLLQSASRKFHSTDSQFVRLQSVIDSCERNYHRALKELQRLRSAPGPQPQEHAATSTSNGFVWYKPQRAPKPPSSSPETSACEPGLAHAADREPKLPEAA